MTVEIRKRQVGVTDRWIIEAVDGKQVRNELDIDFALAGNPAVKKYIPPDQLWVEMWAFSPGTWKIISDLQEEGKLVAFIGDPLITEVPAKP
jgi:hypothetical protein